ncbi:MAG: RsmE family RNA methyltransferase [Dehalococcoidia bacterium]|nr:RsmE family RNA methyltransferase [Dehalococcoidia bacterium]
MHRFFIPPDWIKGDRVVINGSQARQLRDVLRLKPGDLITVLDNTGMEYRVRLVAVKEAVIGEVVDQCRSQNDPGVEIILYQAILKGNKFDFVLQKCTEIGVSGFVPILCERCVAGSPSDTRINRWHQILIEAAEQSRRGKVPALYPVMDFRQACEKAGYFSLLPWEGEQNAGIKTAISNVPDARQMNIFIGPEGGFTQSEVDFARSKGINPVTLGRRILRAETAGLVAGVAILYERDELSGAQLT